jgi:hypothetical protein
MSQAAAKGIRSESSRKASLFEMLKGFGVVETTFMSGLVGMVIFVSVGLFGAVLGAPIRSLFVGVYTLTVLSAMVLAVRWYVMTVRLMRGRGESSG